MSVAAVILAGGASRRMGTPKALLEYQGETFLDRLIGIFERRCQQVIVVLGCHADRIRSGVRRPAQFVFNPDHELGQLTSLQCGLRAAQADRVFFTPVDFPAVDSATLDALIATEAEVVVPRHRGRHGHPVLIAADLIPRFLELPPDRTARDVMHALTDRTRYVDVDDAGVLRDIDTREDYEALNA